MDGYSRHDHELAREPHHVVNLVDVEFGNPGIQAGGKLVGEGNQLKEEIEYIAM